VNNQHKKVLTIIIVGASGFLGSQLFANLSKQHNVIGTYFSKSVEDLVHVDTSNKKQVVTFLKTIKPDLLIDCSGMTRPDQCEKNQPRAYQVNVEGVANLTAHCSCKVIYFSTDYVFDGRIGQYTETDKPNPINYYGWTKLEAEKIVLGARPDNVVLRVAGLYGYNRRNNEFLYSLSKSKSIIYKANDCISSSLLLNDVTQNIEYFWSASGLYHLADGETLSRHKFALKAANILGLTVNIIEKPAHRLYSFAQRPKNSSLISTRHNLYIRDSTKGLNHMKENMSFVNTRQALEVPD